MINIFTLGVILSLSGWSNVDQDILLSEKPRPLSYQIEMKVDCAGKKYAVAIESQGRSSSRLVNSTLNDIAIEFRSATAELGAAISQIAVTEITPTMCDPASGIIILTVGGYDPKLDGVEGETGEVVHTFTPQAGG